MKTTYRCISIPKNRGFFILVFLFLFLHVFLPFGKNGHGLFAQNNRLWATYYGGTGSDVGYSVACDVTGNVFMAGATNSASAIASGGFQNNINGGMDAYLVKFDGSGGHLWATYYGGTGDEYGWSIANDAAGNIYLAGNTTSASSIASGGFQNTYGGGTTDAFLVKFNPAGNLLWSTYYGGTRYDNSQGVATDASGNVYISGRTNSASGMAAGGFQNTYGGGNSDAFVVKFDATTGNRLWATYYGGTGNDQGYGIASDAAGNLYLSGITDGASGITSGGFQNTAGGGQDVFLVKFDAATGNRLWATYYGGTNFDMGSSVASDGAGNVYLSGMTANTSGIASGGFQNTYGGGNNDAFLVKFDGITGNRLWATYYGGTANEEMGYDGLATDATGNVYFSGDTYSPNTGNVIASGGFQNSLVGIEDVFVAKFDAGGNRLCATYYGQAGPGDTEYGSVAVDMTGNVYLGGITPGPTSSGLASGGFQNTFGGNNDAFLVKFTSCVSVLSAVVTATNIKCKGQCTGTASANPANGTAPYTYLWSPAAAGQTTQTATGLCTGTYTVLVTDGSGGTTTASVIITEPATAITASIPAFVPVLCNGQCNGNATALASGGTPAYTYVWNTVPAQSTSNAAGLCAGTYTVLVTDSNGCISSQTVMITEPLPITSSQSVSICGSVYTLPGGTVVSASGTYKDTLNSVNGCDSIVTIAVTINPLPPVSISPDVTITPGTATTLTAGGGGSYQWTSGETTSVLIVSPVQTTTYCVTVTDANNCTNMACVTVFVHIQCGEFYLPNAFSPNNDGENEVICPQGIAEACIKELTIVIYNRWGEMVYSVKDDPSLPGTSFCWDGAYKSDKLNTSVFVFYMEAILVSGNKKIKQGNISLIK